MSFEMHDDMLIYKKSKTASSGQVPLRRARKLSFVRKFLSFLIVRFFSAAKRAVKKNSLYRTISGLESGCNEQSPLSGKVNAPDWKFLVGRFLFPFFFFLKRKRKRFVL